MRLMWVWRLLYMGALLALPNTVHSETWELKVPAHTVKMHETVAEITMACKVMRQGKLVRVRGCWVATTLTMHLLKPNGFCDAARTETAGHEYWHVLGWRHGADYVPDYAVTPGCKHGEFNE